MLENKIIKGIEKIAQHLDTSVKQVKFWYYNCDPPFPMRQDGMKENSPYRGHIDEINEWFRQWVRGEVRLKK